MTIARDLSKILDANGDLNIDANTLFVDSSTNSVGIGTSSPSSVLHIKNNTPKVIIEDGNNSTGGASYTPYIEFNALGDNVGSVGFSTSGSYFDIKAENYNSAPIRLFTAGSEAMRIDSSGNVGIGTSSPTSNLTVSSSTQYTGLHLRNGTNTFAKLIGFVSGNDGGGLTLATGGTEDIKLLSGTGLSFDGGSNYLDDYEEGNYTVVVTSSAGQTATLNSSFDTCSYTKIGRMVHVQGFIRPTGWDSTPTGVIQISLPFANQDLSEEAERCVGSLFIKGTTVDIGDWVGIVTGANSVFRIYRGNANDLIADSAPLLGSGDDIHFSITYQTGS
jgi:hypothetical protein